MYYNRKKEIIKNVMIISFILLIAVISTYYIYNKYKQEYNIDYNSKSLDVIFHEKSGDEITLDKVTPLTDSVGLSTKSYTFTINNNLTETVKYKIKIVDDIAKIAEDECGEYQISKDDIKISIKDTNKGNAIYNLTDIKDGILSEGKLKALASSDFTIRVWVKRESTIPNGTNLHYHGKIQVLEKDNEVAMR